jgi:hypothetical protein
MLFSLACSITIELCAIGIGKILTNNNSWTRGMTDSLSEVCAENAMICGENPEKLALIVNKSRGVQARLYAT